MLCSCWKTTNSGGMMYMGMSEIWYLYERLGGNPQSMMAAFERISREMAPFVREIEYEVAWWNTICGHGPPTIRIRSMFDGYDA